MLPISAFPLPASVADAKAIQAALREQLILEDRFERCELIAGVDVGYDNERGLAHASIVTMPISTLHPQEQVEALVPVDFPYIPGLLSFREIPAILEALGKLKTTPDLLMVDGMGIAHPRRMGIAAHLGVHLNMPSIGVGKSRLTGRYEMPGPNKGSHSPLMDKGEQIGIVLRSRDTTNPLFISPGHRVSMESALAITLRCLTRFRLPEPTRMADKLSKLTKTDDLFAAIP